MSSPSYITTVAISEDTDIPIMLALAAVENKYKEYLARTQEKSRKDKKKLIKEAMKTFRYRHY